MWCFRITVRGFGYAYEMDKSDKSRLRRLWKIASLACVTALSVGACAEEPPFFIPGTATLPACDEPPAFDVSGLWSDSGVVTIDSTGCSDAQLGETLIACPLTWELEQSGNDVGILVDEEYIINGRLCGDTLYLEGGWWLPVQDEGECTYEDDSAEEVGIQQGGSTLVLMEVPNGPAPPRLVASGILDVRGPCEASYDTILERFR